VSLDHAATTPMHPAAVDAMLPFLGVRYGNPSGAHALARDAKTALEEARDRVAALLGCAAAEVVFTGGGTEADNLALLGAARAARRLGGHDGVVVTAFEHKGVLAPATQLAHEGFRVAHAPVDGRGVIDLDGLAARLDERTAVVSVMLVNNEVGTVQPLADVATLVRERAPRAVLHTDAVQAVPWLDVAEHAAGAGLIAVSAHKFGGPKGVGALVVRGATPIEPVINGGGQERGFRSGTVNVAGVVAMTTALELTVAARAAEVDRVTGLRDRLTDGLLAAVPDAFENGARDHKIAGNAHVGFRGVEAEALLVLLDQQGVYAAAGSSCSSGATEPSHVLAAMGVSADDARASIRCSLGHGSTSADVDRALAVVPDAVAQLRRRGLAA
jgi:cysteine desulfurase